ncbi:MULTISPECIES: IclR family transcriptional regulator [Halobacterium]|uniref:Probable HTH-type transcriptional regulator ArcR n=4 Tax=Halobacterium salinarum TaxID=2242 RepID=ARCR_HALS3|nr:MULTISPECIES: IclR family transcriptional regulator [Halobacterium]B0R9X6.1 RecName: Full=Probable HTH-type transcriptional regulator ArcR [Halobacterium salinarum R1]AAG20949.1 transcription regulator [Halobacterium salinarum NRC-1]MBB6090540.1 DNA-binding IclR family transcriptional regulator [Halobacterium salinarum]MCF2206757.1 IclR family transcriptional regulator [Halobacterium salinarum]MCF2240105.1 IclR family transcriptional regulator [Halobacterium salinarum]MDL0119624.1 IclR fam
MDPEAANNGEPRRITSVLNAVEIIDAIKEHRGITLQELTTELDLTKATIHTYMATLRQVGIVEQDGDGTYQLGDWFVPVSNYARNSTDLYRLGREEIDKLATQTRHTAHLVTESDGRQIVLYESMGEESVTTEYHLRMRETPRKLHTSAAGKSILAFLPEGRRETLISEIEFGTESSTPIGSPDALREQLATVRDQGYAINDEEEIHGIRSIGAPIRGRTEDVAGAVSVTAPKTRLQNAEFAGEVPALVMEAANIIEVRLETA